MKILVTGPRGFIARNLLEAITSRSGYDVHTLDRDLKPSQFAALFNDEKFDAVIHLATFFLKTHEFGQIAPLVDSNLTLTTQLLDCASKSGVKKFITFGTYYEFPAPASLYAATKAAMAPVLDYYARQSPMQITELYLYDTYGPGDTREKILNVLINAAVSGQELALSPGLQKMKLIHVQDVCSAIVHTLTSGETVTKKNDVARYSIEPLEAMTLKEIAQKVESTSYCKINAKWGAREYTPGVQMDPKLPFPPLPGWTAQISLDQGLVEVAKSC